MPTTRQNGMQRAVQAGEVIRTKADSDLTAVGAGIAGGDLAGGKVGAVIGGVLFVCWRRWAN
jgi:hypothetical protein